MDRAHGTVLIIKPEEWTGKWSFIKDSCCGKNCPFVLVNGHNLLNSGDQVLDPIFKGSGLFHDAKYISHVATAVATPVTGIRG